MVVCFRVWINAVFSEGAESRRCEYPFPEETRTQFEAGESGTRENLSQEETHTQVNWEIEWKYSQFFVS